MTLSERQGIFLFNFSKFIQFAFANGFVLTAGELYRPPEMQKIYFDTKRSKTLTGLHPQRLAGDVNIFKDGTLLFQDKTKWNEHLLLVKPLGDYWLSLNTANRWGGDFDMNGNPLDDSFHDPYHFEMRLTG